MQAQGHIATRLQPPQIISSWTKPRGLKEGIKCSKNTDEIKKDLRGWAKLPQKHKGDKGNSSLPKTQNHKGGGGIV